MKIKSPSRSIFAFRSAVLVCLAGTIVQAAPLTATTAVHTQPNDQAPTITVLAAGTEPIAATDEAASTPDGWLAVELPGPFEVYVPNGDILKSLDVRAGAALHLAPKSDSPVLTTAEGSDAIEITGLHGKWTQLRLDRKVTGFIRTASASAPMADRQSSPITAAPVAAAPVSPTAHSTGSAGHPSAPVHLSGASGATLPRHFQGRFVSTRSPFKPRRPFDWALNDDAGKRFAFLDTKNLLLTEQIESYIGHTVVVYGAATPTPDGKEFVIAVESLQLK